MPVDLRVYPCPETERIMIAMIIIDDEGTRVITPGLLLDKKAFVKLRENSLTVHCHYFVEQLRRSGDLLRLLLESLKAKSMTFERNIRAAEGYADLEMYDDALAELDQLDPGEQDRLETILLVRGNLIEFRQSVVVHTQFRIAFCCPDFLLETHSW